MQQLYVRKIELVGGEADTTYLTRIPVMRHLQACREIPLEKPVTFFVGENGTGKSTLLEAVAVAYGFNPEGGTKNFSFTSRASHSRLSEYLRLWKGVKAARDGFFLRAESFYNAASYIDELDEELTTAPPIKDSYGGISLHEQSHGESFLSLITHRFGGRGLYVLDEPEAALSPMRQLTLLARMHELVEQDSQFIIATHSPMLMAYPDADIYVLDKDGIVKTPYRDTEHYQVSRQFLEEPERMLRYLFEAD